MCKLNWQMSANSWKTNSTRVRISGLQRSVRHNKPTGRWFRVPFQQKYKFMIDNMSTRWRVREMKKWNARTSRKTFFNVWFVHNKFQHQAGVRTWAAGMEGCSKATWRICRRNVGAYCSNHSAVQTLNSCGLMKSGARRFSRRNKSVFHNHTWPCSHLTSRYSEQTLLHTQLHIRSVAYIHNERLIGWIQ